MTCQGHMSLIIFTELFQECEEKVTGFEIQEEYHAADLHKELVNLKKVLGDEKRRSNSDSNKLTELQALFANSMKSYNEAVEHAKQLGTSSSHVFTNSITTNLRFLSRKNQIILAISGFHNPHDIRAVTFRICLFLDFLKPLKV